MSISRIYRVLQLITLLQSGRGFTASELAEELEVSRRTVFRDLNMLEMAHIPYYFDKDKHCYRISEHFFLPPVNLTLTEALAVLMLSGRMKGAGELPLLAEGARAAVKLESALPDPVRRHVGSVMDHLSVSLGPVAGHEGLDDLFNELSAAVTSRRVCHIVYISFHERGQVRLDVHPLRLIFHGRAWYVLAYTPQYGETRTYKLGRIRKLTVTGKAFHAPTGPSAEPNFGGAWGMIPEGRFYDVRLRFAPKVAGNVAEVRWHPSQQIEWRQDGSADFLARVNGLGEITWWILGYGDQVEVIAPRALRKRIADTAAAMAAKNAASASSAERGSRKEGGVR